MLAPTVAYSFRGKSADLADLDPRAFRQLRGLNLKGQWKSGSWVQIRPNECRLSGFGP